MILSAHQPVYLPSLHLFSKIYLSDKFMFLGHCQVVMQSWHTRNKIRMGNQEIFLSVPIKKSNRFGQSVNDTEINGNHWARKHISSIQQVYGKRPFFDAYFPDIESLINQPSHSLGSMNMELIKYFTDCLGIQTPIFNSENYEIEGHKTDMLISICKHMNADQYLSNEGSRAYVQEDLMIEHGIVHCWQEFKHPVYDQGKTPFLENMSVIDALFNLGGEETGRIVREAGWIIPGEFPAPSRKSESD